MTHVLVVKTSSLGDVIHTLPALTDAMQAHPDLRFDWVVEEAFAEIPAWHPAVDTVIPVAVRRWRRHPFKTIFGGEWTRFKRSLRSREYDKVIDAQGLIKSALLTRMARGRRHGLDRSSAREPLASFAYHYRVPIARGQHAVTRTRQLFARTLGYPVPEGLPDYGIERSRFVKPDPHVNYLVFLHGTTWPTKEWPEPYWVELAQIANAAGFPVRLPRGNAQEYARAQRIAKAGEAVEVLPAMGLSQIAEELANAQAVVGVDTGLAHLAAALSVPSVTLYGATQPGLTGTVGRNQQHVCAEFQCSPCLSRRCTYQGAAEVRPACYAEITPQRVWHVVDQAMARQSTQDPGALPAMK
jgi:heptosyltransferase-1